MMLTCRGDRARARARSACATSTWPARSAGSASGTTTETHLIPIALQVAAGSRESLAIFGDDYPTPDGTCVRDYIHVDDLADAHTCWPWTRRDRGEHRIYNLGSGAGFSVQQVIDAVRAVTGHPVPTTPRPAPGRRPGQPGRLERQDPRPTSAGHRQTSVQDMVADAWEFARAGDAR